MARDPDQSVALLSSGNNWSTLYMFKCLTKTLFTLSPLAVVTALCLGMPVAVTQHSVSCSVIQLLSQKLQGNNIHICSFQKCVLVINRPADVQQC